MSQLGALPAHLRALTGNPHPPAFARALAGSLRGAEPFMGSGGLEARIDATYRWICQAQDASPDGGVAAIFDLWSGTWSTSYPETTGYIIPTLLSLAAARGDDEAYERAVRMARWECDVQMDDGAVLSGLLDMDPGPAVFNTGQVVFGWLAAYSVSGEERFADAARRACEWLLDHQSDDGAWRSRLSIMTTSPVHSYNVRCAWALMYAAEALGEPRYAASARQACDWALAQRNDRGWFAHNGFAVDEVPLLHTISYVIEGLVGVHAFGGDERYLDAARAAVDGVLATYDAGRLAGRLDEQWRPTVSWRCPTGEAQIAVVLYRIAPSFPEAGYRDYARRLTDDVAAVQRSLVAGARPNAVSGPTVGGVPGSFPVWGSYVRFGLLNWAAKFFLDALLLETHGVDEQGFPPSRQASGLT